MTRLLPSLIRISGFVRKEAAEVLRQPRLVGTLILGPFLILLLFGLGYSSQPIPIRTLFVVPEDSLLRSYLQDNVNTFVTQLVYEGMTSDEEQAKAAVRSGHVDVAVAVPDETYQTVDNSQQAVFTIYHDEIDPIRARYARAFADILVNALNQRILQVFAEAGQREASNLQPDVAAAQRSTGALRRAFESGDPEAFQRQLDELDRSISDLETTVFLTGLLLGRLREMGGLDTKVLHHPGQILAELRRLVEGLREPDLASAREEGVPRALAEIHRYLAVLDAALERFRSIDAQVLITPFKWEVQRVIDADITLVDYYVPGVIAILLQHLCVTFGALSIVGEQRSGTMELFQASPLSAVEVLTGKYLAYLLFTLGLTAALTALLELTLGLPMLGNWAYYALAIVALLFAALGLGFVLSLLAQTRSQAVQYSMLALLVSVFFSGFFLNLDLLRPAVRAISWTIPGTYAIRLLQDIMLRGWSPDPVWSGILVATGAGLAFAAWLLLRRAMART